MAAEALWLGLMSGTSLDGTDAVLCQGATQGAVLQVLAHVHQPFQAVLRDDLLALNSAGANEIHRAAIAANGVAHAYAQVVGALLRKASRSASSVAAIGAHGQTVRHQPQAFGGTGYTVQLLNGALLAELTGIDVVCDFRSRDVAAGGQGAPLVPAFHAAVFAQPDKAVAVLNVGGMANLSLLPPMPAGHVRGFDCGPGNALMDAWCQRHLGQAYDAHGDWAAQGRIHTGLLQCLLAEPFFAQAPPKSTGRELFDDTWLAAALAAVAAETRPTSRSVAASSAGLAPVDVQATLCELTALSATEALRQQAPGTAELLVCGGGAFNSHLMRRLQAHLDGVAVLSSAARGVPPDQVEALAFAWLARAFVARRHGNLAAVTGALGPRVLGALYPA